MGKKKLCRNSEILEKKNRKEFFEIVSKPKYFCTKCGRVACEEEYLCKPSKLKQEKNNSESER